MYSCRLCDSYPCNHKHTRDLHKIFHWLISEKGNLPVPKFSNRMIISELSNGRSAVNMSTHP